jgi:hypothetical protein
MGPGVEMWGATRALRLGSILDAYLPYAQPGSSWRKRERDVYADLLARSQSVIEHGSIVGLDGQERRLAILDAYQARNECLVHQAEVMVVCWNGKRSGGTHETLQWCVELDVATILLRPRFHTVTVPSREQLAAALGVDVPETVAA